MVITLGIVVATASIVANALALADLLENENLPAPIARGWIIAVILVPGIGAALWLSHRTAVSKKRRRAMTGPDCGEYPSPRELRRMHEQIGQFRSPNA